MCDQMYKYGKKWEKMPKKFGQKLQQNLSTENVFRAGGVKKKRDLNIAL